MTCKERTRIKVLCDGNLTTMKWVLRSVDTELNREPRNGTSKE